MTIRFNDMPEMWAGVECTVNRVGDRYIDQLSLTGHDRRLEDLDRIASLGVRTVRYPVLWERVERSRGKYDWSWTDERLDRLRELGLEPIAGLVHHGSGPPWTSLLDKEFASGLADFADRVADRYRWLRRFTIVNEPLTTARFSCLYGHWFPHATDDRSFVRALVNQCRAVVLGMEAIRRRIPDAELIQTEDVSLTRSTPGACRQAAFYEDRTWLTFDLLCGRVIETHPLHQYLVDSGITRADLEFFVSQSRPPDIVGLNYYVASDRFLDENLSPYDESRHHHTADESFVDIEAARMPCGILGHAGHLKTAWNKYGRPLAITEVHLDCSQEDQLRWLAEAWNEARRARRDGIPVEAVTAWSLFGSVDWDSLLTRFAGYYECGAFDVRGGLVRRRALADAIGGLASAGRIDHPAARGRGWWRRQGGTIDHSGAPILVIGAGTLGRAIAQTCEGRGLAHVLVSHARVDITDADAIARLLYSVGPWAIVNAAGYVRVDDAEREEVDCWRANVIGPTVLAQAAVSRRLPFVTFSSDLVFDGRARRPYLEADRVSPLSAYGRSKAAAEARVLASWPRALIIRTAAFFGPDDDANAVTIGLRDLLAGRIVRARSDSIVSPTYVPDLARATLELLIDNATGIWHLANDGAVSWVNLIRAAAQRLSIGCSHLQSFDAAQDLSPARRPAFSALGSSRGVLMPSLDSALDRYVRQIDQNKLRQGLEPDAVRRLG